MQRVRGEFGNALVVALVSIGLILGALSISLVEFVPQETVPGTDTLIPSTVPFPATDTFVPPTVQPVSSESPIPKTSIPSSTPTPIQTSTLFVPRTATNTSSGCIPGAAGWIKNYSVKPGDNLFRIAVNYYTTLELMRKVNCRTGDTIFSGEVLWVPNISATRISSPTSSPANTVTPNPTDPLTETALPYTATYVPTNTPFSDSTPSPTLSTSLTELP